MIEKEVALQHVREAIFGEKEKYSAEENKIVERIWKKIENSARTNEISKFEPISIKCTIPAPDDAFNNQNQIKDYEFETQLFHVEKFGPTQLFFDTLNGRSPPNISDAHKSTEDWMNNTNKNNSLPARIKLHRQEGLPISTKRILEQKIIGEKPKPKFRNKKILLLRGENYPVVFMTQDNIPDVEPQHDTPQCVYMEYKNYLEKYLGEGAEKFMSETTFSSYKRFCNFIEEHAAFFPNEESFKSFFNYVTIACNKLNLGVKHEDFTSICEVLRADIRDDLLSGCMSGKLVTSKNSESITFDDVKIKVTDEYTNKIKEQLMKIRIITKSRKKNGKMNFENHYKTLYHYRKHGYNIRSSGPEKSRIEYYLKNYVDDVISKGMLLSVEVNMYTDSTFVEKKYGYVKDSNRKNNLFVATKTYADSKTFIATAHEKEKYQVMNHFNNYPILFDKKSDVAKQLNIKSAKSHPDDVYYGTLTSPLNLK